MTDLQIESFLVRRYRCPFCPRTASRPVRIREHAARCWWNPAVRGCKTCKHFEQGYEGDDCDQGVSLEGRPACEKCGGFNYVYTGETFRPHLAAPGRVMAQCTACGGDGAEVKPGPIAHCGLWEALARDGA